MSPGEDDVLVATITLAGVNLDEVGVGPDEPPLHGPVVTERHADLNYQPAVMVLGPGLAWWFVPLLFGAIHAFALEVLWPGAR